MRDQPNEDKNRGRSVRYAARRFLRTITGSKRVRACGVCPIDEYVAIRKTEESTGYAGVAHCAAVWLCPVCSHRIQGHRAAQVSAMMENWVVNHEGGLLFATLTVRHNASQTLKEVWSLVSEGWTRARQSRSWRAVEAQYGTLLPNRNGKIRYHIPYSRFVEVTWNRDTGWHVHVHAILYTAKNSNPSIVGSALISGWEAGVRSRGGAPISRSAQDVRAVDLRGGTERIAKYVLKAAYEATMSAAKQARSTGSRTPFQILADIIDGDQSLLPVWAEWEEGSYGKRQVQHSQGLVALLGVEDLTDEEILLEDLGGDVVRTLATEEYRALVRLGVEDQVLNAYSRSLDEGHQYLDAMLDLARAAQMLNQPGDPPPPPPYGNA